MVVEQQAGVDRRKSDRDSLLDVVYSKSLERPARDRNVTVGRDPLCVDRAAQPVVAGYVVPARHRLVARDACEAGDGPQRVELEPAVRFEIAAQLTPSLRPGSEVIILDLAVRKEAADLESSGCRQAPVSRFDRRESAGVKMRDQ